MEVDGNTNEGGISEGLPPEYLTAIGEIAVAAAHLEFELIFAIWKLTPPISFEQTLALVGGENFDALLGKLGHAISLTDNGESYLKRLGKLCLSELSGQRNRYIHSFWIEYFSEPIAWKIGKKMRPDETMRNTKPVPLSEIRESTNKIKEARDNLSALIDEIRESENPHEKNKEAKT